MKDILLVLSCVVLASTSRDLRAEGLILRLPADGARVSYDLQGTADTETDNSNSAERTVPKTMKIQGVVTLGSVGRERVGEQECRWIEIGREIADPEVKSILRVLIPERYFGKGEDPFSHVSRIDHWNLGGTVKNIADSARMRYEIERFRGFFPDRLRDVKSLGKRVIQTPLGPIECEGRAGTAELQPSPLYPGTGGEWAWKATIEIWASDKSPFGVVSLQNRSTGYETAGNIGKKLRFKSSTTLIIKSVGDSATASPKVAQTPARKPGRTTVKGRVTGPDGKALAGPRVLFEVPGSSEVLTSVTDANGQYEGEAPVGTIAVRVSHRIVDPDGRARATILRNSRIEVPAEGGTLDLVTQKGIPK